MAEAKSLPQAPLYRLTQAIPYQQDPTHLFHALCQDKPDCLLLESAEIDSKQNLKSLMIVDSAVRIVCQGQQVTFTALSDNGQSALAVLSERAAPEHIVACEERTLTLQFSAANDALDEDTRLQQSSSFDALRLVQHSFDLSEHDKHSLFLGGLFAYDMVANFENLGQVDALNQCPDFVFYLAESLLIVDHQSESCILQGSAFAAEHQAAVAKRLSDISLQAQRRAHRAVEAEKICDFSVTTNISDGDFCRIVSDLKDYVIQGDIFQVVPSRSFIMPCPSPLAAYEALKKSNPSPYMFYMQDEKFTLFGASPESALKYDTQSNQIEIYPIAGTRRRGKNAQGEVDKDLDSRIELELRNDKKENAEHMMLVDLARNDVARIAKPGSRYVADLLKVDRYSHVMHLVSRVVGQLRDDLDALHAYQACMNMGTLTGAPKIRAMQLIRQVEQHTRGSYGGAVGYLTGEGTLDTCIVIRSAYVENGQARVQAGAGVVYDSDPQSEADETRGKAQAVIQAIQMAHQE